MKSLCVIGFRQMALLLAVVGLFSSVCFAQSSVVFVPSTDTQDRRSFYLSLESYAHFAKYENGGFQSYGPSVVYGVAKNLEVGLNYYFTHDESGSANELQPNIKWRPYNNEEKGVAVAVGSLLFVPLNDNAGDRTSAMIYANASKSFKSAKELRLTGGIYRQVNGGDDFGTKTGILLAVEQPLTEKFSLLADWTTGENRLGYSNIGFNYGIKKSQNLTVAYTFGNSGRGNNYLSLFYGSNF